MIRRLAVLAATAGLVLTTPAAAGAVMPATPAESAAQSPAARTGSGTVVGHGTAASCSSRAVVRAVRRGGVITFDCGPDPVRIVMRRTAEVLNTSERVVLDGGGLVTLSGGGKRRILRQDTCDPDLVWTTSHCDDQATPRLVLKRITFADGLARSRDLAQGSGGAVSVRGGRLRIVDARFEDNRCTSTGPDHGGAAVRVLDQHRDRPVRVVRSTFTGGRCSNGGTLSSIGVSWHVVDSVFTGNRAIGRGANPARPGTLGGGSGGAIYMDGNDIHLTLLRTRIEGNVAREGGGAVFFVSNDRTGTMAVTDSTLRRNPSRGFENWPGIFFLGAGRPVFTDSVVR